MIFDTNELTRLLRTGTQAAVAALAAWLLNTLGLDLDVGAVMVVVFPIVMMVSTAAVQWVQDNVPGIGLLVGLLNGPRRQVDYIKPLELNKN